MATAVLGGLASQLAANRLWGLCVYLPTYLAYPAVWVLDSSLEPVQYHSALRGKIRALDDFKTTTVLSVCGCP